MVTNMVAENLLQIQYKSPSELVEYARNPRQNEAVVDKMCSAIREFGFRIPIVAKSDGSVVDGHLRLKAAKKLGLEKVPVIFADDLSEAQVKAFRLLANQSANWASWDENLLQLEFEDLRNMDFDLELTGFELDQIHKDFLKVDESRHEESVPEISENTDPITKPGDLWILGNHKVFCGDSTDPSSYKGLLAGEIANLTITDPPYNVNYDQDGEKILNDNLGGGFNDFLSKICSNILANTSGAIYIFMAISEIGNLKREFEKAGGHWSTFIIWAKNHFALSRSDYQRQYEPILYGWRKGSTRHWCGDRDQSDLWTEQIVGSNKLHPTMKPVALLERMILNSSKPHDIVLDPFGGSGSTLIACENLNRQARLIELDPKYVDVIVKRWENHTGLEAVKWETS
jgi:DNA modification methylase